MNSRLHEHQFIQSSPNILCVFFRSFEAMTLLEANNLSFPFSVNISIWDDFPSPVGQIVATSHDILGPPKM